MENKHHLTVNQMPSSSHSIAQLNGSSVVGVAFPSGSKMMLQQTIIPVGWSEDVDASAALPKGLIIIVKD